MSPLEIIRSPTTIAAEIVRMPLGIVESGTIADLLGVDGNPLENIGFQTYDLYYESILSDDERKRPNDVSSLAQQRQERQDKDPRRAL